MSNNRLAAMGRTIEGCLFEVFVLFLLFAVVSVTWQYTFEGKWPQGIIAPVAVFAMMWFARARGQRARKLRDKQSPAQSARNSANAQSQSAEVVVSAGNPSILSVTHLWLTWLRIAIERAKVARRARKQIESSAGQGTDSSAVSSWLQEEFEASVVVVAASAHALDALYGSIVIPQSLRDQWPMRGGPPRPSKIREALKQPFDTGPVNHLWVGEFDWLFDLRDAAAHAKEVPKTLVPHPIGTNTAPEMVDYSIESADRAVTFALSVFRWCVDHPRRSLPEAVQWANYARPAIEHLEQQWSGP